MADQLAETILRAKGIADENLLAGDTLDCTVVRPSWLRDGAVTGRVHLAEAAGPCGIPRSDVAAVLAALITVPATTFPCRWSRPTRQPCRLPGRPHGRATAASAGGAVAGTWGAAARGCPCGSPRCRRRFPPSLPCSHLRDIATFGFGDSLFEIVADFFQAGLLAQGDAGSSACAWAGECGYSGLVAEPLLVDLAEGGERQRVGAGGSVPGRSRAPRRGTAPCSVRAPGGEGADTAFGDDQPDC
ncbi:NAD(P)H-binding protein [Streptomyces sp. NPDC047917]|uniref:NAD(P)H-binding protein n=1 Tax=Streptomyces sp. NPDC047917 TaxID=3365491 RepID=UPI0037101EAD